VSLVKRQSHENHSTVRKKEILTLLSRLGAPCLFIVQDEVCRGECLRGMVIYADEKMVTNEGQGECVTLRRTFWTAWSPGSL
jgi:hypothetical protein